MKKYKNRDFSKDFLKDTLFHGNEAKVIKNEIVDQRRWEIDREMIFEYEGKLYGTVYSVGSTEYQESEFWNEDPVECYEVQAVEKTVVTYIPIEYE